LCRPIRAVVTPQGRLVVAIGATLTLRRQRARKLPDVAGERPPSLQPHLLGPRCRWRRLGMRRRAGQDECQEGENNLWDSGVPSRVIRSSEVHNGGRFFLSDLFRLVCRLAHKAHEILALKLVAGQQRCNATATAGRKRPIA